MIQFSPTASKFLKIGIVLFCLMCLFFATNMASKYEQQKTETEIHRGKVKELEEKIHELSTINQELLQMRYALVQEKEQLTKEISVLREKSAEAEDWKVTTKKETSPAIQSDNTAPVRKPEETSINK
ncbi:MAG TPA: hypothetical protein ACFYEK_13575 [Candidatus Wunengus sp. YC60]|uniref:hypothetical protein n=1 Tax=Candidatus Wunengus sp. YC60 TaxID=3367697 RepID=UPI0040273EC8